MEHARAGIISLPSASACVDVRRKAYCLMGQEYYYHNGCVHNEYRGLVGRHLLETISPTADGVAEIKSALKLLRLKLRRGGLVEPWSEDRVIAGYSGKKRRAYETARDEMLGGMPISRRDGRISAFVKAERRRADSDKDPRIIQHRSVKFTLRMLTYVKAVEERLYHLKGDLPRQVKGLYTFPKHLNQDEKACLISRKYASIPNCRVYSGDFSRFDQHVSRELVDLEHGFYLSLFGNKGDLPWLCQQQKRNKGKSMGGIKYWCDGRRMSGDANTSLGNNVLVWAMVTSYAMSIGGRWDVMIDGDDFLVFYEGDRRLPSTGMFEDFGHVVEGEVYSKLTDVVYNQSKVCVGARGLTLVRDPKKVVDTFSVNYKHFNEPIGRERVLKTSAQGMLALYSGIPVLQTYAQKVVAKFSSRKLLITSLDEEVLRAVRNVDARWYEAVGGVITDEARNAFHLAFGISPTEQLDVEARELYDFPVDLMDLGPPIDFTPDGRLVRLQI